MSDSSRWLSCMTRPMTPHVLTAPIVDKKIRPGTKSFRKDHAKIAPYSCPAVVEASGTEQAHRRTAPAWNRMHGESVRPCGGDLDVEDQRSPPAANAASWHL